MTYLCTPMKKGLLALFVLVFSSIFFVHCNSYDKLLKSRDMDLKYAKAQEYYEKGDYYRAQPLFEELISVYKGTQSVEKIYYYYAYCEYGMHNYLLAAYHFRNIYETYPNSKYAEECHFQEAYCYYLMSPRYTLDQDNTSRAIDAFQMFINMNDTSKRIDEANTIMEELRRKLEMKALSNAELYYNVRNYKAASISYRNLLREFPDTEDAEEAHYMVFKSNFKLAKNSIQRKQKERFTNAMNAYHKFVDRYPSSKYLKDAENDYFQTVEILKKLNTDEPN